MKIEVIVLNKKDAIKAEKLGLDRVELVSEMDKGGLTPNIEVVKEILDSVTFPVQVMIRPHDDSFYYDDQDVKVIKNTVKEMVEIGATNLVFGALTKDNTIDEALLKDVLAISPAIRLTFHRAFDESSDLNEAYETLCKYSPYVERILTSGGKNTCVEGKDTLQKLVEKSNQMNGPVIMPGSGLSAANFSQLHQNVQAEEYHFGKGARVHESFQEDFDNRFIEELKKMES